jgi:hypothetical protein
MRVITHGLLALSLLLVPAGAALAAPDCDGGAVRSLRVSPSRLRFEGSITRKGAHHDTLLGGADFTFTLAAGDDPSQVLFTVTVPAAQFATRGRHTKYDRTGSFPGKISLRDSTKQQDTVVVSVRVAAPIAGVGVDRNLRASFGVGGRCARTCVAPCGLGRGKLRCKGSVAYRPFADQGFGGFLDAAPATTSSLCGLAVDTNSQCDFLIEERCVLPYPSSYFLKPDASTPTGLRLAYGPQSLPKNLGSVYVDPTDWNTLDGYSPGPMILALFPDTGSPVAVGPGSDVAFHTNFARSLDADHPIVLMNANTGERIVHFAELDANTTDVTRRALIVRPGRRLDDATRYIVAFRNLVDTNGQPIEPRLAFRAIRDGGSEAAIAAACGAPCAAAIVARRPAFDDVFPAPTGERRRSGEPDPRLGLHDREQRRADGLDRLGPRPGVRARHAVVHGDERRRRSRRHGPEREHLPARHRHVPGAALHDRRRAGIAAQPRERRADAERLRDGSVRRRHPARRGERRRHAAAGASDAVGPRAPRQPHADRSLSALAQGYDFMIGGVDMQGMSSADVPTVVSLIQDLSKFHFIPERLHQGFLNHLLLGRLFLDGVNGFNSDPAFQFGGVPLVDTTEVYYSGGSQGGIFGVAIMSIAEDFKRGFLAVPAANYSTLLHRSVDFDPYLALQRSAYPDRLDEEILLALIQQLWDRAEPQGYMNHLLAGDLSDPPVPHKVLVHMATYDSEVSNLGTEIMVRLARIPQVTPVHRSFFDIPELAAPFDGSAFVEVNPQRKRCNVPGGGPNPGAACTSDAECPGSGDPATHTFCDPDIPPLTNQAPPYNNGNHGSTGSPAMGAQIAEFLKPSGNVQQFCAGPCDPN